MEDLPPEVLGHALQFASSWRDVVACAGVCKSWRQATQEAARCQLLETGYDSGVAVETFEGFQWSDFETLREASSPAPATPNATPSRASLSDAWQEVSATENAEHWSPKTPSPDRTILVAKPRETLLVRVIPQLEVFGHLLASVYLNSFSLDDAKLRQVLQSCPNLRRLALSHVCAQKVERSTRGLLSPLDENADPGIVSPVKRAGIVAEESRSRHVEGAESLECCGCASLTGAGFKGIGKLCPSLRDLDLVLHHVNRPGDLMGILRSLSGVAPKLRSLSVRVVEPVGLRHVSPKRHYEWVDRPLFTWGHLEALMGEAGALGAMECLRLEPWSAAGDSLERLGGKALPRLRSLGIINPAHRRIDGTTAGGVAGCSRLSSLRGLRHLQLAPVSDVEGLLEAMSDPAFVETLERVEVECHAPVDDSQRREMRQMCEGVGCVVLTCVDAETRARVQREWRHGVEVLY